MGAKHIQAKRFKTSSQNHWGNPNYAVKFFKPKKKKRKEDHSFDLEIEYLIKQMMKTETDSNHSKIQVKIA